MEDKQSTSRYTANSLGPQVVDLSERVKKIETFNRLMNVKDIMNKDNSDEVDLECACE